MTVKTITRKQLIGKLVSNCSHDQKSARRNWAVLNQLDNATLLRLNAKHDSEDDDEDDDDDEMCDNDDEEGEGNAHSFDDGPVHAGSMQAGNKGTKEEYKLSGNAFKLPTERIPLEQRMTKKERATLNFAMRQENAYKLNIVRQLVSNIYDPQEKERQGHELMKLEVPELERWRRLMTPPIANQTVEGPALFVGAGTYPVETMATNADTVESDVLDIPTLNMKEISEEQRKLAGTR